jgi:hypothetical protein
MTSNMYARSLHPAMCNWTMNQLVCNYLHSTGRAYPMDATRREGDLLPFLAQRQARFQVAHALLHAPLQAPRLLLPLALRKSINNAPCPPFTSHGASIKFHGAPGPLRPSTFRPALPRLLVGGT